MTTRRTNHGAKRRELQRKGSYIASYILRKIDPDLWHRVKVKALNEKISLKQLFERFLVEYLKQTR